MHKPGTLRKIKYLCRHNNFEHLSLHTQFRAFKPSCTFLRSIYAFTHIFKHLSLHTHFRAFKPSCTFLRSIYAFTHIFNYLSLQTHFRTFKLSCTFLRSIKASKHPWLISPDHSDQMSQRSQISAVLVLRR